MHRQMIRQPRADRRSANAASNRVTPSPVGVGVLAGELGRDHSHLLLDCLDGVRRERAGGRAIDLEAYIDRESR